MDFNYFIIQCDVSVINNCVGELPIQRLTKQTYNCNQVTIVSNTADSSTALIAVSKPDMSHQNVDISCLYYVLVLR